MNIPLSPYVPEKLVSRYGFSRPVPRQPAHVHTHQVESGAYLRDPSRVPRRRPFMKPPYAIGSVPSLSGQHAIAFRWCSLPRVRRHRASQPQGSSERVLPLQVTMDQLICASLSHTHYWCEVGMLKVPAVCMCVWVVCNYQVGTTYQKKNVHTYVRKNPLLDACPYGCAGIVLFMSPFSSKFGLARRGEGNTHFPCSADHE